MTLSEARLLQDAVVVRVPLRIPFRRVTQRTAVLLSGPSGFGEFAPFPEYAPLECSHWLDSAVAAAYGQWPATVRDEVPYNAIIPSADPVTARQLAADATAAGVTAVKVKVAEAGQDLSDDLNRLAAVRETFSGAVRIDANGAWDVPAAVDALTRLDRVVGGLEYAEQPCASLAELAELRARVSVPIAADESIRKADDPQQAARHSAVDIVVLKVPPLGGVRSALAVAGAATAAGMDVVVSSAMDTGVGLAAGVQLAACLPDLNHACGLGTSELIADDIATQPAGARPGHLRAGRPEVDERAWQRAVDRVPADERQAALDRMVAAWRAGTAERWRDLVADFES